MLNSCYESSTLELDNSSVVVYKSSAEYLKGSFLTDSLSFSEFTGVDYRTKESARTGQYGVKIDSNHLYGFNLVINDPKEGELYHAIVWQKKGTNHGGLHCSIRGENKSVVSSPNVTNKVVNGWVKRSISFVVSKGVDELVFYVAAGKNIAYFDDIEISRFSTIPVAKGIETLKLYIPEDSKKKLEMYTDRAIKEGVISPENKAYVKGFILDEFDSVPVKIRLKGDWVDHLTSGKPSYRIKIKGNYSFNGLKTFSIQHPKTRNYLNEWFMHEWCKKEGILATEYDFLPVFVNGDNMGVYAIEEHFDKQLLEKKNRREGVMLKYDESAFWDLSRMKEAGGKSFPYFQTSFVSMFKKGRTLKNSNLKKQFIDGAKAMSLYKEMSKGVEGFIDLELTAKYFVILDLGCAFHANNWHNRRFYFNPITQNIENVGFDMLAGEDVEQELMIMHGLNLHYKALKEGRLDAMLYKNEVFREYYMGFLNQFTDSLYLTNLFDDLKDNLKSKESLMKDEFIDVKLNKDFYYKRAIVLKNRIPDIVKRWNYFMETPFTYNHIKKDVYVSHENDFYLESVSVNAYVHKIDSAKFKLEIENYHLNDVTILGYKSKGDSVVKFKNSYTMNAYKGDLIDVDFIVDRKPKAILFSVSNSPDEVMSKKVLKWRKPKGVTSKMKLAQSFSEISSFYKIIGTDLIFNSGELKIDKLIYVPSKYKVMIYGGTKIDFINGGGLVVNNEFRVKGSKSKPIIITSSDKNNHGITVLKANKVTMEYVEFSNLNSLHYKRWSLTGGVTIYESETVISNCIIKDNLCEDGLNIIRSNFRIDSLRVQNTKSDGFDADFCTGIITNSNFENTGNDCIDFSGSEISVKNINILNSGDKGISAGEASVLHIENITINGAITGLASKDGSIINGFNVTVNNAEFGLAVFRKKAEYSGASIELDSIHFSQLQKNGIVESGSFIKLDGQCFYGFEKVDIESLYLRFEKK